VSLQHNEKSAIDAAPWAIVATIVESAVVTTAARGQLKISSE
jgi:hypothetical protein